MSKIRPILQNLDIYIFDNLGNMGIGEANPTLVSAKVKCSSARNPCISLPQEILEQP